jgi:hypothetical protein
MIESPEGNSTLPEAELIVVQQACDVPALQTKTQSWFAGSPTRVHARLEPSLEPRAVLTPSPIAGVRVWIVTRDTTTVWLYFAVQTEPAAQPRYLMRDIKLDRGFDELGLEQVAQVIYLASTALWTGQLQSPRRQVEDSLWVAAPASAHVLELPKTKLAVGSAPPVADRSWELHPELGYDLRLQGHEGMAHGPQTGLRLLRKTPANEIGGRVSAQLILPHEENAGPVQLQLRGYSTRAALWFGHRATSGSLLFVQAGPGVDFIRYSVASMAEQDLQSGRDQWQARPLVWLALGSETKIWRIRLGLQLSVTVQLTNVHYDLVAGNQRTALLTPWIIQPGETLHLAF